MLNNGMERECWRLSGLKLSLNEYAEEQAQLRHKAAAALGLTEDKLPDIRIHKKSLDAREAGEPCFIYSVNFDCTVPLSGRVKGRGLTLSKQNLAAQPPSQSGALRLPAPPEGEPNQWALLNDSRAKDAAPPVVIGAGPAGLFAALSLAEAGYRPLLLEQGQPVEQRQRDVELFWRLGCLNENSNVQSGEGGAGTFSDGKLTFRGKDPLARLVLQTLIELGAAPEILYWHKPHLGSDKLLSLLPRLRQRILSAGGRIYFGTRVSGLILRPNAGRQAVAGLTLEGEHSGEIEARAVILAPGNGARHTFLMLERCGAALVAKPFAVGLRVEHSQSLIDGAQYGAYAGHAALPAADYQLKYRAADGRGFYSFCMCPGGRIVNAASAAGGIVTNGISLVARASGRANSALVGEVMPGRDFADDPLAAVAWQQGLEQAAYVAGGADHALPVCMAKDYLSGGRATPPPAEFAPMSAAWRAAQLRSLLPEAVGEGLAQALSHWQGQIQGFAEQAVLAGVESRTSSPVRIPRGPDFQSVNVSGLFPAGEGAGYAGGILSSAIDGIKAAAALMEQYQP